MDQATLEQVEELLRSALINVDNIPKIGPPGMQLVKMQIEQALEPIQAELDRDMGGQEQ